MNAGGPDTLVEVPRAGESAAACVTRIDSLARRRTTPCGDGEMVWRVWGEGPPIVLFHGGYGSWSHWIRNIERLAEKFCVIAADMPGHGDSDPFSVRAPRAAMAETIARGLDEIIPANTLYALVGFSMGANLSALIASLQSRNLATVITVGAGGLGISEQVSGLRVWRPDLPRDELDARHRHNLGIIMFHDPARIDDLAVHVQRENGLRMRFRGGRPRLNTLLRDHLPELKAELKCIWGAQDVYSRANRDARLEIVRGTHPDVDSRVIDDAGHWVMYEQADAFNAMLLDMLGAAGR